MSDWLDIETAPKDGTIIGLRRIYKGSVIAEGPGLFGRLHEEAPSRGGLGPDPLGRLTADDYRREDEARKEWSESAKWLRADRLYAFPTPTHWKPVVS